MLKTGLKTGSKTVIENETFDIAYRFMDNAFAVPNIENIEFNTCTFNLEYVFMYSYAHLESIPIRNCDFKTCTLTLNALAKSNIYFENCNFDTCTFTSMLSRNNNNNNNNNNKFFYTNCTFNTCNMRAHYPCFSISGGKLTACDFTDFNNIGVGLVSTISSVLVNCKFENSICRLNFTNSTLTEVSFKGAQLISCIFNCGEHLPPILVDNPMSSEININNCSFENAQFSNTTFTFMYFTNVVFKNVDFLGESSRFYNVHFGNCALHEVKTLTQVRFQNCIFELDTAKLHERFGVPVTKGTRTQDQIADWKNFFKETEFSRYKTDLSGLDMSGFYFDRTEFTYCNLSNINMANTILRQVSFKSCMMKNSTFQGAINICEPCNYTLETYTMGRDFHSTEFNTMLIGVNFKDAELNCVDFRGSHLSNTDFAGAKLRYSMFNRYDTFLGQSEMLQYNVQANELAIPSKFDGADLTNAILDKLTEIGVQRIAFNEATIFTGTKLIGSNIINNPIIRQLVARGALYTEYQPPRQPQPAQQNRIPEGQLVRRRDGLAMEVHGSFKTFAFDEFINIVSNLLDKQKLDTNYESKYKTIIAKINANEQASVIVPKILDLAEELATAFISSTGKKTEEKKAKIKELQKSISKGKGCEKIYSKEILNAFVLALKYIYTKTKSFPEFVEAYIDAFISDTLGAYRATNKVTVDTTTEEGRKDTLSCEAGIVERILLSMTNIFLLCEDDAYTKNKAICDLYPEMAKLYLVFNRADLIENIRTLIGQYKDEWRNTYMRSLLDKPDELENQYGKYIYEIEDEAILKEQLKTFVDAKLKELLNKTDLTFLISTNATFNKEYNDFVTNIDQVQLAFNLDIKTKQITGHIQAHKDTLTDKYGYAITEISTALRKLLDVDEKYVIPEPILKDFEETFDNFKPKAKPATPAITTTPVPLKLNSKPTPSGREFNVTSVPLHRAYNPVHTVPAPKNKSNRTKKRSGSNSSNRAPAPASPN